MINLGLARRHANKPGAVERAAKALAKRRRSDGVNGANYVVHIPRQFATPLAGIFTFCGRRAVDVNCMNSNDVDREGEAVCLACRRSHAREDK